LRLTPNPPPPSPRTHKPPRILPPRQPKPKTPHRPHPNTAPPPPRKLLPTPTPPHQPTPRKRTPTPPPKPRSARKQRHTPPRQGAKRPKGTAEPGGLSLPPPRHSSARFGRAADRMRLRAGNHFLSFRRSRISVRSFSSGPGAGGGAAADSCEARCRALLMALTRKNMTSATIRKLMPLVMKLP
jgi:hypothetical protein